jgi:hypothetical protein
MKTYLRYDIGTPSVTCGFLTANPVSPSGNPSSQPSVEHNGHDTYIIIKVLVCSGMKDKLIHANSFTSDPKTILLEVNYMLS